MKSNIIFIVILSITQWNLSFANSIPNQCVSGSKRNLSLSNQFEKSLTTPLATEMIKKYSLNQDKKTEAQSVDCIECLNAAAKGKSSLQITPKQTLLFKTECLEAATKIQAGSAHISCPSGIKSSKPYNECITTPMLQYQNAVISDFYTCVKSQIELPLSPEILFNMFSNESGFKPNYSHPGGTGMGQLTSIFIADVKQNHRGGKTMQNIATSNNPTCSIAKNLAKKDLAKPPNFSNKCSFVEYGDGFERNILYALVGLSTNWTKDISPLMQKYSETHKSSPQLEKAKELALLNAYGSGGRAAARAAVRRLRKLTPEQFVTRIQQPLISESGSNLTAYLSKTAQKQKQLTDLFDKKSTIDFKQQGSKACLQN